LILGFAIKGQANMSSTCSRLEQERQKREKYLQRKVQETLCLSPPPQPTAEKVFLPSSMQM
jgi:hypothetical protein